MSSILIGHSMKMYGKWELGLKLCVGNNKNNTFMCVRPSSFDKELSDAPGNLLLAWDNVIHATWYGFDGESFDPDFWEVV